MLHGTLTIVQTAQCVSILSSPQIDRSSVVITNQSQQLVILLTLQGDNATSFAKDLSANGHNWPSQTPEIIHQSLLDLLGFCRKNKLQVALSLCAITANQLVCATYNGSIHLQRSGRVKEILNSQQEIKFILGKNQAQDTIILRSQPSARLTITLESLLTAQVSLEKLVSEISVYKQNQPELTDNLAFVSYQTQKEVAVSGTTTSFSVKKIDWQMVTTKLVTVGKKIGSIIKKIYITIKKQSKKKIITSLVIILLLATIAIGGQKIIAYRQQQKLTQTQTLLAAITPKITEVEELTITKPIEARALADHVIEELQALKTKQVDKKSQALLDHYLDQVNTLAATIAAENSLDQLQIAYNLDNFLGRKIVSNQQGIFVLESSALSILWLKNDQSKQTITLPEQQIIKNISLSEQQLFIHAETGLYLFDLEQNSAKQIKTSGESDQAATLMASFGPYIYLLNPEKRNIYRYYYQNDELSEPIGWLIDKQGLNFATQHDLIVDGDLWLSDELGQIAKYTRGTKTDFQIQGLKEATNNPLILANHPNNQQLIVLEKAKRRLLVLTKEGQLVSEIKSNELSGVTSITVDQNNQLLALSGSTIYQIKL